MRTADSSARALVEALRAELAAVDRARPCCRVAERAGLGEAATGHAPSAVVARLAVRLGRIPDRAVFAFSWDAAAEHCRIAWVRGRFLARGSLSLAGGRTHLEFVVESDEAPLLAARLAGLGLPGTRRTRRGSGVVTWKSTATVLRFLQLAGAGAALLELEARIVGRDLRAALNRQLNAETGNLRRSIAAARRQSIAVAELGASGRLAELPGVVRAVARARVETPEATLGELAQRLGLGRSRVQRALQRLELEALRLEVR